MERPEALHLEARGWEIIPLGHAKRLGQLNEGQPSQTEKEALRMDQSNLGRNKSSLLAQPPYGLAERLLPH
jgi:hypothetical protein